MPEIILLCAGAATDPCETSGDPVLATPPDPFTLDAAATARDLHAGALDTMFARGRVVADVTDTSALPRELPDESWLRARFGVAPPDSVAAWAAGAHGLRAPCWRATPAHVEVGRHQIVLADPTALQLAESDAIALADAARPCLADAGFGLELPAPDRWFLSGNSDWSLQAHSWTMAVGRSIDGYLPRGDHARHWRRVFTEIQMAWHEHPANLERAARGLPPVNALWLDGCISEPLTGAPMLALTVDDTIAGLALACDGEHRELSIDAAGPIDLAVAPGRDILVDPGFWRRPRRNGDVYDWREAWLRFDRWLPNLLRDRTPPAGFDRIRLVASAERRCVELVLERGDRWKLLRRFGATMALLRQ